MKKQNSIVPIRFALKDLGRDPYISLGRLTIAQLQAKLKELRAELAAQKAEKAGAAPRPDGFVLPPDMHRIRNTCGVVAISVLAGVPFRAVWDFIKTARNKGNSWTGYTYRQDREAALDHFGVKTTKITCASRRALRNFQPLPGRTYMVRVGGHILVLRDGWVIDQCGPRLLDTDIKLGRKMVTHYWLVEEVRS